MRPEASSPAYTLGSAPAPPGPAECPEVRSEVVEIVEPNGADLVEHRGVGGRRRATDHKRDILREHCP